MARQVNRRQEAEPGPAAPTEELLPGPGVDLRRAVRVGFIGGLTAVFVGAINMYVKFDVPQLMVVGGFSLAYTVLVGIPALIGFVAATPPRQIEGFAPPTPGPRNLLAGLVAGAAVWVSLVLFALVLDTFQLRAIFPSFSPQLFDFLTFGRGLGPAVGLLALVTVPLGALGGAAHLLPARLRRALFSAVAGVVLLGLINPLVDQIIRGIADRTWDGISALSRGMYDAGGLTVPAAIAIFVIFLAANYFLGRRPGATLSPLRERFHSLPETRRRRASIVLLGVTAIVVGLLPLVLGPGISQVLVFAGVFTLTALGLNIVVGYAGLLDLGYIAFFIVGAYTVAVLSSPQSPAFAPELIFWVAIPFVLFAAALSGLLVGTPVLRMRGDYLAIVTLGFGEIARITFLSDAVSGFSGGAQGITQIPNIDLFGTEFRTPDTFLYIVLGFFVVAAWVSYSVYDSRVGRSWIAMREDEPVAEVMGVNTVQAKLTAFVMGAMVGSLGGALFAVTIGSIFPQRLNIQTSIVFLVIVIVGGLASIPGVILAGFLLIGIPNLFFNEFNEFRFLLYGALLMFMMLNRPEGLIPSKRRVQELREEEIEQDAWLRREQRVQEHEEAAAPGDGPVEAG